VEKKRYVQYQQWHIVIVFVEYGPDKLQQGAKCDLIALQNRIIWTADFCWSETLTTFPRWLAAAPEILG